jgi:DNA adenine methylase
MYPGGKAQPGIYQRIINQMPPHRVYVEAFLGGGAVMKAKRPAAINIGLDLDRSAIAGFGDMIAGEPQLIEGDGIGFLESYPWRGDELVYCDPPYLFSTRREHRPIYRCELEDKDHLRFLAVAKQIPAPVIISGYWSEMYARELAGWRTISFQAVTRGGSLATEWLWMNYPEPAELHDYRYLGESFRERERIKRKISRWVSRLERMPILERRALSAALAKVGDVTRLDPSSPVSTVNDRTSSDPEIGPKDLIAENEDARARSTIPPDLTMPPATSL